MTVRTRFAPSPTGVLHIGSVRTALFCWLYARRHGGKFILRIEDTDRERSTAENVEAILDGLSWLGLDADEGPIFQTDRFDRYRAVAEEWLASGKAYHCYCSKEELAVLRAGQMERGEKTRYDGRCRDQTQPREGVSPVIRFRNPLDGQVTVDDQVRGRVIFENSELDDLIIVRSDGAPTYNFTVIIDDFDMQITHVIRGDDHLNNTPRQMNMLQALGARTPYYAHLPMILGADGAKLSKRHGAIDVREYRTAGYLPKAMLNYMVRLGWSLGDQEIFTIEEMIAAFDIEDVNQSASAFDPEKLTWLNQQHIITAPAVELGAMLLPFLEQEGFDVAAGPAPTEVADAFRERAETLKQMATNARFCYVDFDEFEPKAATKNLRPVILEPMVALRDALADLAAWSKDGISEVINAVAGKFQLSMGKLGQPLRVAITGAGVSPPIDITAALVGRKNTLARLDRAIQFIRERAAQSS